MTTMAQWREQRAVSLAHRGEQARRRGDLRAAMQLWDEAHVVRSGQADPSSEECGHLGILLEADDEH